MKQKSEFLSSIIDLARVLLKDPVVIQIEDIISGLGIKNALGEKPIVCHHNKTETGHHVVLNLPVGLHSDDILHWQQYFEEQLLAVIEAETNGSKLHLYLHTVQLPMKIPYHFNPADYPDMMVPVPIGLSYDGWKVVDLSKLPHLFIGGTPGSGKTTEIINIIDALLLQGIDITLIDLKRLDFGYLEKHVRMAETPEAAFAVLNEAKEEMFKRTKQIRSARVRNWREYKGKMPYQVLVIDEVAEIRDRDTQEVLESLVRLCRGAGISVIAACQRPSAKTWKSGEFREVISLFDARICYRVVDTHNSEIVLGEGNTSAYDHIPPGKPGRAIWKYQGECIVQSMFVADPWDLIERIPPREVKPIESKPGPGRSTKTKRQIVKSFNPPVS